MSQQQFQQQPPQPSMYPQFQQQPQQPPPQYAPQPGFAPPPQAGAQIIIGEAPLGQDPKQLTCPQCHSVVITETNPTPGLLTYVLSGVLCLFGCWLGCCLIPCCVADCQDTEHRCPNCKHFFGTHRKM